MHQSFRFEPTTLREHVVPRPRLTAALARRFDVRLTTIVAAAGFGKTTALAQAVESNSLDPQGEDVWLGAVESDADPRNLLNGLLQAVGADSVGVIADDARSLCDVVWQRAPTRVALVIDDAHLLGAESTSVLQQLIEELPTNGHLVLAGRSIPDLAVARLRANRELVNLTEDDLRLDDEERERLTASRGAASDVEVSPHVASADLLLTAGQEATTEYLWEEVLGEIPADRLAALSAASVVDVLDDELALALSGGAMTALDLTAGLPLVETQASGSCRLHALLRAPLDRRLSDEDRRAALTACAEVEVARNRLPQACELFVRAGAVDRAVDAARLLATLPTLRTRLDGVRLARRSLRDVAAGSALVALLDAQVDMNLPASRIVERWEAVADRAQRQGDELIEAVALFRAIQSANHGDDPLPARLVSRIARLAGTTDFAIGALAHVRSWEAQAVGNAAAGLAHLEDYHLLGEDLTIVMLAERLCDLGRPEEVAVGLSIDELSRLPQGTEIFISFAMWLRGEAPPEFALEVGTSMLAPTLGRGWVHTNVSLLGVLTFIAVAAGDLEAARRHAQAARDHSATQNDVRTRLFAAMAEAAVLTADGDEAGAADRLDPANTGLGFGHWPARAHLLGLALHYVLRPESRPAIDACDFGPTMAVGVRAGQALVALRDRGSVTEAVGLPWSQIDLLRVHVHPHHLAELAAAAAAHGVPDAGVVMAATPDQRVGLTRAASGSDSTTRGWAETRLAQLPLVPQDVVRVRTLGPIELERNGLGVVDRDWVRRARVRELMALLVEFRRVSRDTVMELLWPDHDIAKASSSLRATLSHLNRVLEPSRGRDDDPACVQVVGDSLQLSPHVIVDVDEFTSLAERAEALDRAGSPGDAIDLYRAAVEMSRGSYLDGMHAGWETATRTLIDSRARSVTTRLGELELARGEPEVAIRHATAAIRMNELDERAARLLIGGLLAVGDRAGAYDAAAQIERTLAGAGLDPELDTRRVTERLGQARSA